MRITVERWFDTGEIVNLQLVADFEDEEAALRKWYFSQPRRASIGIAVDDKQSLLLQLDKEKKEPEK